MNAPISPGLLRRATSPFTLDCDSSYRRWREAKLAGASTRADQLLVNVANPAALTEDERDALLARLSAHNMALYQLPPGCESKALVQQLGAQLGITQLDANWLADEDGVSNITVARTATPGAPRADFIPYTDRAIRWHTDGYYHPAERQIRSMILHCARPAADGGENALLDHEIAYIALRDASPQHIRALMAPDAMTIPERCDEHGVARPAQTGPVYSVSASDGALHMRYTARTRSIVWKDDAATRAAVACLAELLESPLPQILRVRMGAGMGIVAHNVLHDRSGFVDSVEAPRLLYRARYCDRSHAPELAWR